MRLDFGFAVLVVALSNAVSLPRPKPMTDPGEYLEDNFLVGAVSITDLQFGYATSSMQMMTDILGVCYGVEITGYYCVIDQMYLQGIIASRAFALDLGSVDSVAGSIKFGGIDTMKYTGVTSLGNGVYSVDCNQTTLSGTLDFGFGNTVINVPYHQFIWQNGGGCIFGAVGADPATSDTWILGDTVMRSMLLFSIKTMGICSLPTM